MFTKGFIRLGCIDDANYGTLIQYIIIITSKTTETLLVHSAPNI